MFYRCNYIGNIVRASVLALAVCMSGAQAETKIKPSTAVKAPELKTALAATLPGRLVVTSTPRDLEEIYDEIWTLVNSHYLYRSRLQSWAEWRHRFDGRLTSVEKAEVAINSMLQSLSDEYTFYRDQGATTRRQTQGDKRNVAYWDLLDGGIGYIHLATFKSSHCVEETEKALEALADAKGIILDLRDNPGGCIDYALEIFSLFSDEGTFVSMRGVSGDSTYVEQLQLDQEGVKKIFDGSEDRASRRANKSGNKPLIVLVDKTTKSAAEMLAGALRDNGRATVVGTRTYGKGIVQRVWEFANQTSMKMSAAQFFLPTGESINKIGLEPDFIIPGDNLERRVKQKLRAARRISEHSQPEGSQQRPAEVDLSLDQQLFFACSEVKRKLAGTKAPLITRHQAVSQE